MKKSFILSLCLAAAVLFLSCETPGEAEIDGGWRNLQAGNPQAALREFEAAEAAAPASAGPLVGKALAYFSFAAGESDTAAAAEYERKGLAELQKAVTAEPDDPTAYFHRAMYFFQRGSAVDARIDLDKVIALSPDYEAARLHRANALMDEGKPELAVVDLRHIAGRLKRIPEDRLTPDEIRILLRLNIVEGELSLAKNDFDAAAGFFERALGYVKSRNAPTGDTPEALEFRRRASQAFFGAGYVELCRLETDKALELMNYALRYGPENVNAIQYTPIVLLFEGRGELAVKMMGRLGDMLMEQKIRMAAARGEKVENPESCASFWHEVLTDMVARRLNMPDQAVVHLKRAAASARSDTERRIFDFINGDIARERLLLPEKDQKLLPSLVFLVGCKEFGSRNFYDAKKAFEKTVEGLKHNPAALEYHLARYYLREIKRIEEGAHDGD